MAQQLSVLAMVDEETLAAARRLAADRDMSVEQFAGEAVRRAVAEEADLLAAVEEGRRQIAAGDGITHEQLVTNLQRWTRERKHAA